MVLNVKKKEAIIDKLQTQDERNDAESTVIG